MKNFSNISELHELKSNPTLHREVYSFLSYCYAEFLEYSDQDDLEEHDFNILILEYGELDYLDRLGAPEESAQITIRTCGQTHTFHRYVYPTEIIFWEEQS